MKTHPTGRFSSDIAVKDAVKIQLWVIKGR